MTQQPTRTAPDGESSEAVGRDSGQITRSLILRTALGIIDRDGWMHYPCADSATP
jgi:hypothetical protein